MTFPRKCATKFCRGRVYKSTHDCICSKCKSRRWKERYPLKYSFAKLRARAKERGHEFNLPFEYYEQLAIRTGYDRLKGKTADSLSINRKNNNLGYVVGNVEVITLSENSRKMRRLEFVGPHIRALRNEMAA